ncbi:TetR/AcrR family transcriptional regulator [Amycolatopsis minnesotensis]|uniref:TetR/AcrR family transcriptional regulator n=1 Tax=Amycolatopsis minnesotensis TaxID=337894 RepID=A0ABN2R058_9PSEU
MPDEHPVIWARPERGSRGPKPAHTRDELAAAALRVADSEGLDAVTMRRVAAELGSGVTSLYRYVTDKSELIDLMSDAALGEVDPPALTGKWRADLRAAAGLCYDLLRRRPWLAAAGSSRPSLGPNGLRWMEYLLSTVEGATADPDEMLTLIGVATMFAHGAASMDLADEQARRRSGLTDEQWMAAQGSYGDSVLTAGRYPLLAKVMIEASIPHRAPGDTRFTVGIERLLDGIEANLPG